MKSQTNAPAVTLATVAPKAVADLAKTLPTASAPAVAVAEAKAPCVMEVLGELAKDLNTFASEFATRMAGLSERIEDIAMTVGVELESNAAAAKRLKQLQALLKGGEE